MSHQHAVMPLAPPTRNEGVCQLCLGLCCEQSARHVLLRLVSRQSGFARLSCVWPAGGPARGGGGLYPVEHTMMLIQVVVDYCLLAALGGT